MKRSANTCNYYPVGKIYEAKNSTLGLVIFFIKSIFKEMFYYMFMCVNS